MKRYRVARDQTPRNFAAAVRAMPSTSIIALPKWASYSSLAALAFVGYVSYVHDSSKYGADDSKRYLPVVYVTLGWFSMWYWFLFQQSATHLQEYFKLIEEVKKKGTKEKIVLSKVKKGAYNRYPVSLWNTTVRNTLEQSISFLPLLWFCAVFGVDGISRASFGGWVWIGCRMMYPYATSRTQVTRVFWSTIPGYFVQVFFAMNILANTTPLVPRF